MSNQTFQQARPSKPMSSRLMTMKFMQRAAASTSPSTPQSQSHTLDTLPSKRQKVSAATSSIPTPTSDLQLIQVALTKEEEKKEKAINRLAEEAGETKWVLSTVNGEKGNGVGGLRVANAGYSEIDQEAWRPAVSGRRSFGKFNQELEKRQDGAAGTSSSSSETETEASEEDGEDSDDPAGTRELIRVAKENAMRRADDERYQRKQQRRAEKDELARLVEKRRSKEVKLNRLSSISGVGGGGGKPGGSGKQDIECYSCGEKGHVKRDCPQRGKRRNEDWHGGPAKRHKPALDY